MKTIEVVCGVLKYDSKVLIARRNPGISNGGLWEFPGGKVEQHETHKQALKRELQEEMGITAEVLEYLGESLTTGTTVQINLHAYFCVSETTPKSSTDHDMIKLVEPRDLGDFNMAEADVPFIKQLARE